MGEEQGQLAPASCTTRSFFKTFFFYSIVKLSPSFNDVDFLVWGLQPPSRWLKRSPSPPCHYILFAYSPLYTSSDLLRITPDSRTGCVLGLACRQRFLFPQLMSLMSPAAAKISFIRAVNTCIQANPEDQSVFVVQCLLSNKLCNKISFKGHKDIKMRIKNKKK